MKVVVRIKSAASDFSAGVKNKGVGGDKGEDRPRRLISFSPRKTFNATKSSLRKDEF